ncbi:MAG: SNF2-related protein, partial [archaeon]|nr:SNF2-related protein [archaeon]
MSSSGNFKKPNRIIVDDSEDPMGNSESAENQIGSSSPNSSAVEAEMNKEKQQLAAKIRKENENFMKGIEQDKSKRLKFLLKQTEIFAHFLVNNKMEDSNPNSKNKNNTTKRSKSKKGGIDLLQASKEDEEMEFESKHITRLYCQPSILTGGKLTEYQIDGVNWLISLYERGLNGILADEMGLGKTIQSIAFLAYLKQFRNKNGNFLIIVPKSTMPNWQRECKLWLPSLNAILLNPVKEERDQTLNLIMRHKFDAVITSYEGVNICISKLKKIKWEVLIIDEAQRIKNENALLSRNVRELMSKYRILISGTPLQNNLHELWSLLNFLLPDIFSSAEDFDSWFGLGENTEEIKTEEQQEERNAEIVQQLHKILKPFLLRRTKSEVEKTLPPKKEIHIKVGLTEKQKNIYKKLLTSSLINESKTVYKNIIMQLRKACNHPYLFEGVEEDNPPENHLVLYSSKMRILDKLLQKLHGKSQILIFSQMTRMLDILEDYCNEKGYLKCRIDGDTSLEDREYYIQEFTKPNSEIFIFLLSTRAGGLGLNLMTSDTVILYDSDWNPQVDLQAMDRVHRIGQTKPVMIYRLICENTVEEKIIERQAMRLKLDSLVIQQGRVLKAGENLSKDQMKEMIQYGADAIFRAGDDFKDEDIDKILERGEQQTNKFFEEAEKQAKDRSNLLLNFSFNPNELYQFENEDYSKKRKEESEKVLSMAYAEELEAEYNKIPAKRERLKINYNLDHLEHAMIKPIKKKARTAKIPIYHLFDNRERIIELKQKQINYFIDNNIKIPEKFDEEISNTEGLTEEEAEELAKLFSTGFPSWDRKEYDTFISLTETYGTFKDNEEYFIEGLSSKTKEEIEAYSKAFWIKVKDLPEGQKIIRTIEKKEKSEKIKDYSNKILNLKTESNKLEYDDIKITYQSSNRQTEFSYEDDQFLIYATSKFGYGNWDNIIKEIRLSHDLMFNYYLKSRNKAEIQKRVDYLVKIIEKEFSNLSLSGERRSERSLEGKEDFSTPNKEEKEGKENQMEIEEVVSPSGEKSEKEKNEGESGEKNNSSGKKEDEEDEVMVIEENN